MRKRARSPTMKRPIKCCEGPIARHGCTRSRRNTPNGFVPLAACPPVNLRSKHWQQAASGTMGPALDRFLPPNCLFCDIIRQIEVGYAQQRSEKADDNRGRGRDRMRDRLVSPGGPQSAKGAASGGKAAQGDGCQGEEAA